MQMVDTHVTNLVNVHETHVLFKTSTQWIEVTLNVIRLIVLDTTLSDKVCLSDLRQVSDYLWVLIFFPLPIQLI